MGEMLADRFTVAVVFAVDLACLLSSDPRQHRKFQQKRATGALRHALRECLAEGDGIFGTWVSERGRIVDRMRKAERDGGLRIWTSRFLDAYSPWLKINQNHGIQIEGRDVHEDGRLDPSGLRYRRESFFRHAGYRITPEGALLATYQAEFSDAGYEAWEVIQTLANFRTDAFESFHLFVHEYFGHPRRSRQLSLATRLEFNRLPALDLHELGGAARRHTLVFIRGFREPPSENPTPLAPDDGQPVRLRKVLSSGELLGILNETPWYKHYSARYIETIRQQEIGHRGDEIYVVGHHSSVVVAERYWAGIDDNSATVEFPLNGRERPQHDPLYWYQADLLTTIEHHLARLALLRQQLSFLADHVARKPLEAQRPSEALPLVLDGRANLTQVNESLDFTSLASHGFTREFASLLRRQMGLDEQLKAVRRRIGDMSEAINLKSSVTSAKANNRLQVIAIVISVIALAVSVVAIGWH
jgi:hypothetical protein